MQNKPVLVLSAFPSRGGGRAAAHLCALLTRFGAAVHPTGLSVTVAQQRLGSPEPDPQVLAELADLLTGSLAPAPRALSA